MVQSFATLLATTVAHDIEVDKDGRPAPITTPEPCPSSNPRNCPFGQIGFFEHFEPMMGWCNLLALICQHSWSRVNNAVNLPLAGDETHISIVSWESDLVVSKVKATYSSEVPDSSLLLATQIIRIDLAREKDWRAVRLVVATVASHNQ